MLGTRKHAVCSSASLFSPNGGDRVHGQAKHSRLEESSIGGE